MESHTNLENNSKEVKSQKDGKSEKKVDQETQHERSKITDLYKYADRKHLILLFIGITAKWNYIVLLKIKLHDIKVFIYQDFVYFY